MTNNGARVLASVALLVFGAMFLLAGILDPTNEIMVKLPLMSLATEVDRNGILVITGTGADARWLEIAQGLVFMLIGYLVRPKHWEI